ncbi:MAG TPA: WecB/TagA/CpsF family glycosyltransferase [Caulobacterales bacterium]|nr:WecB/TagA/CpsF family glycosyltransferase [Caulobacterales bacterium]
MAFDAGVRTGTDFLNLRFDALDFDAALDAIAARASLDTAFAYVTTPNVDHVVGLAREPSRRELYERAWLTLNDSRVLEALAARAGVKLAATPGSDLVDALFDRVIDRHEPIAIIGGDAGMIEELIRRYRLTDVRWHQPPMRLKGKPDAIVDAAAFAARQRARFTFICVGAPQQEMIAYAISLQPGASGVGICAGASLEFITGRAQRAPARMRAMGLEWLHRLVHEPRRLWRRYLVNGPYVFSLFWAWRAEMAAASAA